MRLMRRDERGSAAIEAAIGVPAFLLFIALIVGAGRVAVARQAVEAAAAEAARSASIERTQPAAARSARDAAAATLANQHLQCLSTMVDVDTGGFSVPVGTPAAVSATVTCVVNLGDVSVPGLPGSLTITETMTSPLDTYRGAMMRPWPDRDRGSVTIWLALASFAMIVLVGLAVDLSGQVYAQQHATNVAAQAARAAGQQVDQAQAMHGTAARTDTTRAVAAARAFLASSGLEGSVTVSDGGSGVKVTTRAIYQTKFLSIIGIQGLQVTGSSDSEVVRAVNGTRR